MSTFRPLVACDVRQGDFDDFVQVADAAVRAVPGGCCSTGGEVEVVLDLRILEPGSSTGPSWAVGWANQRDNCRLAGPVPKDRLVGEVKVVEVVNVAVTVSGPPVGCVVVVVGHVLSEVGVVVVPLELLVVVHGALVVVLQVMCRSALPPSSSLEIWPSACQGSSAAT